MEIIMEKKLGILILEDDYSAAKALEDQINNTGDLNLIEITSDSKTAINIIKSRKPDIIILDIELHNGIGSGFDVLEWLKNADLCKRPYILITTNNSSNIIHDKIRMLGGDFIMSKRQPNYSAQSVISHIRLMSDVILGREDSLFANSSYCIPCSYDDRHKKKLIMSELDAVGIRHSHKGYNYLAEAIFITLEHPVQTAYSIIAKNNNKSVSSIERAMQYSINCAWKSCHIDTLKEHYSARIHSDNGAPTITEFICYYSDKIKNAY